MDVESNFLHTLHVYMVQLALVFNSLPIFVSNFFVGWFLLAISLSTNCQQMFNPLQPGVARL